MCKVCSTLYSASRILGETLSVNCKQTVWFHQYQSLDLILGNQRYFLRNVACNRRGDSEVCIVVTSQVRIEDMKNADKS